MYLERWPAVSLWYLQGRIGVTVSVWVRVRGHKSSAGAMDMIRTAWQHWDDARGEHDVLGGEGFTLEEPSVELGTGAAERRVGRSQLASKLCGKIGACTQRLLSGA